MPTDPPHIHPTDDALDDVVDTLSSRFPTDRDTISTVVHRIYRELSTTATVDTHLIPLTQRRAAEELRSRQQPESNE